MSRRGEAPTRREATERADKNARDLREGEQNLEKATEDIETVAGTLEDLNLGGTEEGADEAKGHVERAQDIAGEKFDEDDAQVEGVQQEGQEHEEELTERAEDSTADRERLQEGQSQLNSPEGSDEMERGKEVIEGDIEFLEHLRDEVAQDREQTERMQEGLRNRAGSVRRNPR